MNSSEILSQNSSSIEAIQNAVLAALSKMGQERSLEFNKGVAVVEASASELEVSLISLIRFNVGKGHATYGIGFANPKDLQSWRELFPAKATAPGGNVKSHEFELTKSFFIAIDQLMKAHSKHRRPHHRHLGSTRGTPIKGRESVA